jgi:hypothetical protein
MADKPLNKIADQSPGVATAAAQKGLPKNEINQIASMFELRTLHNNLTALPQNEAYKKFQTYPKPTRDALTAIYSPKYREQDKGFFGTILNSVKSAVWYGGGTVIDTAKQVIGLAENPLATGLKVTKGLVGGVASEVAETEAGAKAAKGVGAVVEALVRPQEKLIKQPYMAARLAEVEGQGGWSTLAKSFGEGFKELLPGGEDALPTDNSTTWKQYWERASDPNNVYDDKQVLEISKELTPAANYVGRLLASKQDLVDNFEKFQDDPGVIDLVNRYVAGDIEALKEVGNAVARYEKSKISPGRDVARAVISLFPHEYEQAMLGDGAAKLFFNGISGSIDFGVTVGLDPLLLVGKANRNLLVAKYGFAKVGEGTIPLEKAFSRPKVVEYWNQAGKLVEQYRNGDLAQRAVALNRLQDRFKEININVVEDLAKADVKNAEDAFNFFDNASRFSQMMSGNLGIAGTDTLIPRMTWTRSASNKLKDAFNAALGTERYSNLNVAKNKEDFILQFSDDPIEWAGKIGIEKGALGFTAKDATALGRIDRIMRQFAIAPSADRIISIADGSSANQIFKLSRTVLDKTSAGAFRAAWLGADEGQRLLMYKGLLKTLGVGMGLNLSAEGRLALSKIDEMSKEIYSVSQTELNIGDLADVLKTARGSTSLMAPRGVRKKVQDAVSVTTTEGKAGRLIASVNAKTAEYVERLKALKVDRADAIAQGDTARADIINDEIRIVGTKLGRELKTKKELKAKLEAYEVNALDDIDNIDEMLLQRFNAGQTIDGTPRAIRQYQLNDYRTLPDFSEWRAISHRAGVLSELFGKATNSHANKMITDGWSFLNLYPRLGIRTTVEELGTYGVISGAKGFGDYLKGRAASRALRAATPAGVRTTVFNNEKADKNLGFIYDNLYKITNKHYSKEELLAMADDPERLAQAVSNAMMKSKFKPSFLTSAAGKEISEYTGDFARFNGKVQLDDINGASVRAERPVTEAEVIADSLKQFGPSVRFNVQNQEALKGMTFAPEFGEIANTNDKFIFNWLLELNNTVGKRNGQFGNIVLWNAGKKPDDVINKLVDYIEGEGNEIAKRFAIYAEEGAEGLARNIYLDATYALRDSAGRINMDLVNAIRNKGGMENFDIEDLIKLDTKYARPESVLGQEIIPMGAATAEQAMYRVINSGYGWVGKQIALLDREPITLGNYFMFRKYLKGTQAEQKRSLIAQGLTEEGADSIARFAAHESAIAMARNRTLSFVDNGDVRTNLAYSLRTLGRYYRATEDFYRRAGRLAKYEKRAIVRLAIINQSFENSGFIHEDDKGQMYFTYPGDDILNGVMLKTLELMNLTTYTPLPVNFGGYVKMLTPSLDPESALPRLSNPFVSIALDSMTNLPFIGEYLTGVEKVLTGSYNTDIPMWEKAAPVNLKRLYNVLAGTTEGTESRFSSATKAIKLLVSTGNGPTSSSDLEEFYYNVSIQAKNIDMVKLAGGLYTPASIQNFANKDVPKELINAGVFTWDSEYIKILKKYEGEEDALSKAMVTFAKLYPSKLAYTTSASRATTFAQFRKTIEAEKFVYENEKFLLEHRDGGSFFIPATGTSDIGAYRYLKKNGFISNKPLDPKTTEIKENFIREVATVAARQAYYALRDDYNTKIEAAQNPNEKRYWRDALSQRTKGLLTAYPLLAVQVTPTPESNARRKEVINDMKNILRENKAPNKELGETFAAMLAKYDEMESTLKRVVGSSDRADAFKRQLRADTRDVLFTLSRSSDNATAFFNSVLDPLIGE